MGYLDLAKKIEVSLLDSGTYSSGVQSESHRAFTRNGDPSIKVTDYSGPEPTEIPFTDFCHRTIRDILGASSDMLVEFDAISGPILTATGDNTLRLAQRLNPDRAVPFHEIINFLLPYWDSSMMDKRLVDLMPGQFPLSEIVENAKRILGAELVA